MKIIRWAFCVSLLLMISSCESGKSDVAVVGLVEAFEDSTLGQARVGFLDALKAGGFSEEQGNVRILYRNAGGSIPTLTQIIQYFIAQEVTLIASNPSISTITALQNTSDIPVFMMVSPKPELMKLTGSEGQAPPNIYGVGEDLNYIDTSFALIPQLIQPDAGPLRVGVLYNQSEPQSVDAFQRLEQLARQFQITLVALPVNATNEVQLVANSLLSKNIDAFFANPDNTVFAAFETIIKACNEAGVPVFTSEAGLVERGAVAAFGADIYQWGYQAGEQAAQYLKSGSLEGLSWEMVELRRRVYNPEAAKRFKLSIPDDFKPIR